MKNRVQPTPAEIESAAKSAVFDLYAAVAAAGGKICILREGEVLELSSSETRRLMTDLDNEERLTRET